MARFFRVRAAVARYGADGDTDRRLQLATRLEPGNPDYWYLFGRYQQDNLEDPDPKAASKVIRAYLIGRWPPPRFVSLADSTLPCHSWLSIIPVFGRAA